MKNYGIQIMLLLVIFFSCNKDDDDTSGVIIDPLIGDWQITNLVAGGVVGELNECSLQSIIQFQEDGMWKSIGFDQNQGDITCTTLPSTVGTWQNSGNGMYIITNESMDPMEVQISFADSQNEFTVTIGEEGQQVVTTYKKIDNQDPIIGAWNLVSATFNGEQDPVNSCRARSSLEFFPNNAVISMTYGLNSEETECVLEEQSNNTWQNLGNGMYTDGNTGPSTPLEITFSNNNNTFTFVFNTELNSTPITITRTYNRI